MNIKICISTCQKYAAKTIPVLTRSLIKSGIPETDIVVVEGGYDRYQSVSPSGITHLLADHDSYDFTALIGVIERGLVADYWLLLHDTCRVGPNFKNLLYQADYPFEKTALQRLLSMNIGVYQHTFLLKNAGLVLTQKNTDYSEKGMKQKKIQMVNEEDLLFWGTEGDYGIFGSDDERVIQPVDEGWYLTSSPRIQEYFPQLDLFKLKANWGQIAPGEGLINTL